MNTSAQISSLACTAPVEISAGAVGESFMPKISSDAAGGLHVFWNSAESDAGGSTQWVSYSYWDGQNWSLPLDVFYPGVGGMAIDAQGVVDPQGYLHTVYIDNQGIEYARRHVNDPISSRHWEKRTNVVSSPFRTIGPMDLVIDNQGILHLAYWHAGADIPGVYYTNSIDGAHWKYPVMISGGNWPEVLIGRDEYRVSLLPVDQVVHAAWSEPDYELFYSSGLEGGENWTLPQQIEGSGQWVSFSQLPNGALGLFNVGTPPGRDGICYKVQNTSSDNGNTWDDGKIILEPFIKGCLGKISIMTDSQGNANLVASAYLFDAPADNEKIWYSYWDRGSWQQPQLVSWPNIDYANLGDQPDFPTAAISSGNLLNIVFHVTEGKIWATQCLLPVSAVPPVAFPAPEAEEQESAADQQLQTVGSPANATPIPQVSGELTPFSSFNPSHIGMLMSLLVVGGFFAFRLLRKDHDSRR